MSLKLDYNITYVLVLMLKLEKEIEFEKKTVNFL